VAGSLVTSLLKASSSGGGGFEKDDIMFRVLGDACFDLRELSSRFEMWKGYSFALETDSEDEAADHAADDGVELLLLSFSTWEKLKYQLAGYSRVNMRMEVENM